MQWEVSGNTITVGDFSLPLESNKNEQSVLSAKKKKKMLKLPLWSNETTWKKGKNRKQQIKKKRKKTELITQELTLETITKK